MKLGITWLTFFFAVSALAADSIAVGDAETLPQVFGKPRLTQGHPRTLWDQEDIARYQQLLKTSPELKAAYDQLKASGDQRIQEPLKVPAHVQEPDGKWSFPAFRSRLPGSSRQVDLGMEIQWRAATQVGRRRESRNLVCVFRG